MKINHNEIELNVSDDSHSDTGSFPVEGGVYNGSWYESSATDSEGNEYRVIWTDVNWDAEDGSDACNWESPDHILEA